MIYSDHFELSFYQSREVRGALELLKACSLSGRKMVEWAERNSIAIEEKLLNVAGQCVRYTTGASRVELHEQNSASRNVHVISHELMHSLQWANSYKYARDLSLNLRGKDVAAMSLMEEAAAETFATRVSHEIRRSFNRASDAINFDFRTNSLQNLLYNTFNNSYFGAIRRKLSNEKATELASNATFYEYLGCQEVRDVYNNIALGNYINIVTSCPIGTIEEPLYKHTLDAITLHKNSDEVEEGDYVVQPPRPLRTDSEVFGNNTLMRKAFEHVDLTRINSLTEQEREYSNVQRVLRSLDPEENPFKNINITDIPKGTSNPLQEMLKLANAKPQKLGL